MGDWAKLIQLVLSLVNKIGKRSLVDFMQEVDSAVKLRDGNTEKVEKLLRDVLDTPPK